MKLIGDSERGIKMVPCKDCLVLSVCRNRKGIRCSLLFEYVLNSNRNVWKEMIQYLPNLEQYSMLLERRTKEGRIEYLDIKGGYVQNIFQLRDDS